MHYAVDGNDRPLAVAVTGGQRNDGAMLQTMLEEIRVPRLGCGRARSRPDRVLADRAYATGVNRAYLQGRRIGAVIPEKTTEISSCKRKGRWGGRPPRFDTEAHKCRNVIELACNLMKTMAWFRDSLRPARGHVSGRGDDRGDPDLATHMGDAPYSRAAKPVI